MASVRFALLLLAATGCGLVYTTRERAEPDAGAVVGDRDGSSAAADASSSYRDAVRGDAPVVYLRFGEASGAVARDEMGRGEGRYGGGTTLGIAGALLRDEDTAVALDGTSPIQMPGVFDFAGSAPFSVEVWARTDGAIGAYTFLVDHERYDPRGGWDLLVGDDGVFFERWAGGDNGASAAGPALARGAWHHVVGTFDGVVQRLYIDGAEVVAVAGPAKLPVIDGGWSIGRQSCDCSGGRFVGGIDELAIYDRPLTVAQIAAHLRAAGR